jgi:hypothetical protein
MSHPIPFPGPGATPESPMIGEDGLLITAILQIKMFKSV